MGYSFRRVFRIIGIITVFMFVLTVIVTVKDYFHISFIQRNNFITTFMFRYYTPNAVVINTAFFILGLAVFYRTKNFKVSIIIGLFPGIIALILMFGLILLS